MATNIKRRWFLKVAFFLSFTWILFKFLFIKFKNTKNKKICIDNKNIPENGAIVLEGKRVALIKREGKTYAISLKCSHLGCTVKITSSDIKCPCHGSIFDLNGYPIKGPAKNPLKRFKTEKKNNKICIYYKI